jgi:hypothetical protein
VQNPLYYTYIIYHPETNFKYYGCQYGKFAHPDNLWNTYFTSSKKVKELIQQYGKDSFLYEIRQVFDDPKKCRLWEIKVIKRANLVRRNDFLNQRNPGGTDSLIVRKNYISWNKGLAGKNDPRCASRKKGITGIYSEEQLKNLSYKSSKEYQISKFGEEVFYSKYKTGESNHTYGKMWINNGIEEKRIYKNELLSYPDFKEGKLKRIYITDGVIEKSIIPSKFDEYEKLGFTKGCMPRKKDTVTGKFIKQ